MSRVGNYEVNMHRKQFDTPPKKVALFVTCMVDLIYPGVGMGTVELLEQHGICLLYTSPSPRD